MILEWGYHGLSLEQWSRILQKGELKPASRLDVFINRNAALEELVVRPFLKEIELPNFVYPLYSFFIPRSSSGEEYLAKIPESYTKARQFLRQFIDARMEVLIKARLPAERIYVVDFAKLIPVYDLIVDRTRGWMDYLKSFTPLDKYTEKEETMPEILVSDTIPLENIVRIF
ncbi:hypothetical protein J4434_02910 [Candidatus Woesearchaeota archaeon]|nr:hypothetical protein [Candidatus Woesearchaeota archaeon]